MSEGEHAQASGVVHVLRGATPGLTALWGQMVRGLRTQRGGAALLEDLAQGRDDETLLEALVRDGSLWSYVASGALLGFAICQDGVIELVYVAPDHRRRGIGRSLVTRAAAEGRALDGRALPGDRATKSLYESIGWKARLLTMRAE